MKKVIIFGVSILFNSISLQSSISLINSNISSFKELISESQSSPINNVQENEQLKLNQIKLTQELDLQINKIKILIKKIDEVSFEFKKKFEGIVQSSQKFKIIDKVEKFGYKLNLTITKSTWQKIENLIEKNKNIDIFLQLKNIIFNFDRSSYSLITYEDLESLVYLIWLHFSYYRNLFYSLNINQAVEITSFDYYKEGFWSNNYYYDYNKVIDSSDDKFNQLLKAKNVIEKMQKELVQEQLKYQNLKEQEQVLEQKFFVQEVKYLDTKLDYEINFAKNFSQLSKLKELQEIFSLSRKNYNQILSELEKSKKNQIVLEKQLQKKQEEYDETKQILLNEETKFIEEKIKFEKDKIAKFPGGIFSMYDLLNLKISKSTWIEIVELYFLNPDKKDFLIKLKNELDKIEKEKGFEDISDADLKSLAYLIWNCFAYYYDLFLNLTINQALIIASYSHYPQGYFNWRRHQDFYGVSGEATYIRLEDLEKEWQQYLGVEDKRKRIDVLNQEIDILNQKLKDEKENQEKLKKQEQQSRKVFQIKTSQIDSFLKEQYLNNLFHLIV